MMIGLLHNLGAGLQLEERDGTKTLGERRDFEEEFGWGLGSHGFMSDDRGDDCVSTVSGTRAS